MQKNEVSLCARKFCHVSTLVFIPLVYCTQEMPLFSVTLAKRAKQKQREKAYLQSTKAEIYYSKCRQSVSVCCWFLFPTSSTLVMRIVARTLSDGSATASVTAAEKR